MNRPLLIGPMPPPVNGQANCFKLVVDSFEGSFVIDRNVDQHAVWSKSIKFFRAFLVSVATLSFRVPKLVYISLSRSWPGHFFDVIVILLARFFGARVVVHLHGNDFLVSGLKRWLFGWAYRYANVFIVLSQAMSESVRVRCKANVQVVINPIMPIFCAPLNKPNDEVVRVVYLSNVMTSKGIFDFIHLAEEVGAKNSCFQFHIIGKVMGDHLANAKLTEQRFKQELDRSGIVKNHGPVYGESLANTLMEMDILVFPSFYPVEAFPLSILESAALGLDIILNDHNDLRELSKVLPNVHVCRTREVAELSEYLSSHDKRWYRKRGLDNSLTALRYKADRHVKQLSKIFNS